jgi:hypothetical protein
MNIGDLVIYSFRRAWISPTIGIVLDERHGIAMDGRFYTVLLQDGTRKIVADHYLQPVVQSTHGNW